MRPGTLLAAAIVAGWLAPTAHAAPTPAQLCESAMELASAKYAQCRLNAESEYSKAPDLARYNAALAKCSTKLSDAFGKLTTKYGMACAATEPSSAFDAYLQQCSDEVAAAAGGAALPDYVGDLAACNADLTTCNGDLATCSGDLATCTTDLATTEADLATCNGDLGTCNGDLTTRGPPAPLLKTGQTSCWDEGGSPVSCAFRTYADGNQQSGVALSYVDNGNGTVTDVNTGLMWEKLSYDGSIHDKDNTYKFIESIDTRLASLNAGGGFAGHTDWRAPNRRELESLVNLQNENPAVSPAFNTGCVPGCSVLECSCTASMGYWSSSSYVGFPSVAWVVFFYDGGVGAGDKTDHNFVRAVRAGS
jgi:hypothetical protein